MDFSTKKKKFSQSCYIILMVFFMLGAMHTATAQTPGLIYEPATGAGILVLDPNGDGYVSSTVAGFTTDDQAQSEIAYKSLSFPTTEPTSDLGPGPDCGFTDFADQGDQDPVQAFLDANGNWLFRMRMGKTAPNAKSYSVLIDTDGKFGGTGPNKDPQYSSTNPGFEVEIVLATKFGVFVYDVNNMNCTPVISYNDASNSHYQKSVAMTTECGDPDYFYDFYVNFSDITREFSGFTSATPVRMTMIDNMAADKSTLCNLTSASDVAGIDDAGRSLNSLFSEIIANYNPTTPSETKTLDRTLCPKIDDVISGATEVSGTSTEAVGTLIAIYKNGAYIGSTNVVAGVPTNTWVLKNITPAIAAGSIITATATAPGKGASIDNCDSVIVSSCSSPTAAPATANIVLVSGSKGYTVTAANRPIGTIVRCYNLDGTLVDPVALDLVVGSQNPITTTIANQTVSFQCKTGNCFSGAYTFTFQEPGKCESAKKFDCRYLTGSVTTTSPIIIGSVMTESTSVSGTVPSPDNVVGVVVNLYVNGIQYATTKTVAGGAWTINGLNLSENHCQTLSVEAINPGKCISASILRTIQRKAFAPVVNEICSASLTSVLVSGTSEETAGTKINLYINGSTTAETVTATVLANGTWAATVASGTINSIKAKAFSDCLTLSDESNTVTVHQQSTNLVTINATVLYECGSSVSGTGTNGDTISLYIDGSQIGGVATVSGGTWTISGLGATCELYAGGLVTATASTGSGCGGSASIGRTVACVNPSTLPTLTAISASICSGTAATVTVVGSEKGIIYQLYNGLTATGSSRLGTGVDLILTSAPLTNSTELTVKANRMGTNCSISIGSPFTVTITNPTASKLSGTAAICNGATANLSVAITGGIAPYTVTIDNGVGPISNYTSGSAIPVSPTANTTYSVTAVSGADGCPSFGLSGTAAITVNPMPIVPTVGSIIQPTCATATGSFAITNYNAGYAYTVSPSTGVTKTGNIVTAPAGTYTVTTTLGTCTSTASEAVAINSQPVTPVQPTLGSVTQPTCTTATGSFVITNYNGNYTYTVSPSTGVTKSGDTITAPAGIYTVTATSGSCTSTVSASATVNFQPTTLGLPTLGSVTQPTCTTATGSFTIANYNPSYTYVVSPAGTTMSVDTVTAPEGTYTVKATFGSCTSIAAPATVNAQPTTPVQPTLGSVTQPTCTKATGSFAITNYDAAYNYTVSSSTGVTKSGNTITAPEGTYSVTATLGACTSTASASATVNVQPETPVQPILGSVTQPTCTTATGSFGIANYNSSYIYTVSPSEGVNVFENTITAPAGNYTVTATLGACTSTAATATVDVQPVTPVQPTFGSVTQPTCTTATGSFTITNYNASYNYSVSQAGATVTGNTITAPEGTYTVTASLGACTSIASATAIVSAQPATPARPDLVVVTQPSCPDTDGSFEIRNYQSNYNYTISPSNGIGRSGATVYAPSGTYTVTAVSPLGCSSVTNTIVLNNLVCPTNDSGSISATGGTAIFNVLSNDKVGGVQATFANATIAKSGTWPAGITLDTATGAVNVASGLTAGTYTIAYEICDKLTTPVCSTATITVVVAAALNQAPKANNDNYTVAEGGTLNIMSGAGVLVNDTDPENNALKAILISGPAHGALTLNPDGSFIYTHDGSETTSDSFIYKVNDGQVDGNDTATVYITVTSVNDAPVAVADNYTVAEDATVTLTPLNLDTDVDGNTLSVLSINGITLTTGSAQTILVPNGTVNITAAGMITFTPALNFNGTVTFPYSISDGNGGTATANEKITVTPVNDAPVAVADNYTVAEGATLDVPAKGVLVNDSDVEGNTLNAILVDGPANGRLTLNANGSFVYIHDGSETTSDSFKYKVNDGTVDGNTVTVTITITRVNDAPVANVDTATTMEDVPVTFNLTGNDSDVDGTINSATVDLDPTTAGIQSTFATARGTWSVNTSGDVTFTPASNYNGTDSIDYTVNDNEGATSNKAKITVTIDTVNDAPVAVNNAATTQEDTPVTINVTANDTDVDGTINSATVDLDLIAAGIQNTVASAHGTWSVNASGEVTFTPASNYNGTDFIDYTVNDNSGATSNTATITITINAVNDAPVAVDNTATTQEDTPVTVNVTANDTDVDGTIDSATVDLDPATGGIQNTAVSAHGTWSVNTSGVVNFTPASNYNGTDSIYYIVKDNSGATSNPAKITITIEAVNDAPVAVNNTATTQEDTPVTVNVTANDTDVDGTINNATVDLDPTTAGIQNTVASAHGSWSVSTLGVVTFTPNLNYFGTDSIDYTVNDNSGVTSNTATITVTITTVNDAPVAENNAITTQEDTAVTVNVTADDTDVDGTINSATVDLDPATAGIQPTFTSAHGTWSVNASGDVTFTPALNYNGTDFISYTVNDNSGATSNAAMITVTVAPVNDKPVAATDSYTVAEGGTLNIPAPGALANDTDPENDSLKARLETNTTNGTLTFNADGSFTYVHNGGETTSDSFTYTVNDGTVDGNTVTVSIIITAVNDAPVALDDATNASIPSRAGATAINDLKATDVDGTIASYTVLTLPAHGTLVLSGVAVAANQVLTPAQAASLTYDPSGDYSGVDTFTFTATDNNGAKDLSPATITINVDKTVINAVTDTVNPIVRGDQIVTVVNVLNNDLLSNLPVVASDVNLKEVTADPKGVLTLKEDGTVELKPNSPAGTYTLTYEICEKANPTNCASATVSVTVIPPAIVAGDDSGTAINGYVGGTVLANVLANDTLNGTAVNSSDVILTLVSTDSQKITLSGNSVVVAAGTPAGTYSLTYRICEELYLDNCDSAVVSVLVTEPGITATDDTSAPINGIDGGKVSNILSNDTLNGTAVNKDEVIISLVSPIQSDITLSGTDVIVAPVTAAGIYYLDYQICEVLNPDNCARATVKVTVTVPGIDVKKDEGTVNGLVGGTAVANILANDIYNGAVISEDKAKITLVSTAHSNITLSGTAVVVAPGTPAGDYELTYEVCSKAFPNDCARAIVTVTVTAPGLNVNDDEGTPVVGEVGGMALANVLANDTYNDGTITDALATTTFVSSTHPNITLSGKAVLVAEGTPAGDYSLIYQVCSNLNTNICATATVSVTVTATAILAEKDTASINGNIGGTAINNVLANDKLNGRIVTASEVNITTISSDHLTLVGTAVTVAAGTPAGTYTLIYNICEKLNPNNCAQGTVTVTVTAPAIIAVNDTATSINGYVGGIVLSNVLANDTLNGTAVIASEVNTTFVSSTNSNITLSGTDVKVAAGTPAGTYLLTYSICEKLNLTNCSEATVSVTVTAPAIVVRDVAGSINGYVGGTALTNVLTNATLNGIAVKPSEVTTTFVSSTNPNITLSGTDVKVAPGTPAGTYTLTYTVCEILNPTNCAQGIVTITVTAPAIIAVNDTATSVNGYVGGTVFANVLTNDTVNGTPVIPSEVNTTFVSSTNQNITLSGTSVIVASGTAAGTYSLTYSICENLNPNNCSQATVSVTVTAAALIVRDALASINGYVGGTALTNVLTNATLNGTAVKPSEITTTFVSSTNPNITLSGTDVRVAPGTPAGTYTLTYTVCEILNQTNCAQGTVTVKVNAPAIDAVNDTATPVNGYVGGTAFTNVLENDTLDGTAVTASEVNIAFVSSTNPNITLSGTDVMVAAGTPAGTYSLTYSICEKLNPNNCSQATVRVTVNAAAIVAESDTAIPIIGRNGGSALANVLTNDTLNGISVNPSEVKITLVSSSHPDITLSGTAVVVAPGTDSGIYTLTYSICEKLNPDNCAQADVKVSVISRAISAGNDTITLNNGYVGGAALANILANDKLNGTNVKASEIILKGKEIPSGITLKNDGTIDAAAGISGGTYTLTYEICEAANSSNCSIGTVTIFVEVPSIALLETVAFNDNNGNGFAEAGETLTYRFTVTNTGNTDLENIRVSDPTPGMTIAGEPINLAAGTSDDYSFVGTYVLTQDDVNARRVVTQGTASGTAKSGVVAEDKSDPTDLDDNNPTVFELNGCVIKVFNAVSPNGDSKNARFYIQGIECYPDNTVSIFNRWGVLVYERDHYDNTDVVFKGFSEGRATVKNSDKLPEGSYYYVIKYKDGQSNPHQEVGYLYLSK